MSMLGIRGNLKFVGYSQDRLSGKNGQYLRYCDGLASWATVADDGEHRIVTVPSSEDVLVDNDGNVVSSGLDETYHGVDTKPGPVVLTRGQNSVAFLSSQIEYNDREWIEGDIFIPTIQGITELANPGSPAIFNANVIDNNSPLGSVVYSEFISTGINTFATSDDSNIIRFGLNYNTNITNDSFSAGSAVATVTIAGSGVTTLEGQAARIAEALNKISIDPMNPTPFGTVNVTRNFEASSSGITLVLTFLEFITAITPLDTVFSINAFLSGLGFSQVIFPEDRDFISVEDTMYVRRQGNNGWLQFPTASENIIIV